MRRSTLVGLKFGRLEVLKKTHIRGKNSNDTKYLCLCSCGKKKSIRYSNLINAGAKSCGCLQKQLLAKRTKKPKGHSCKTSIWNFYKRNAKTRNLSWNLSKKKFIELILQPCYYCGIKSWTHTKQKHGDELYHNGVDRKDSFKGYSTQNCVPCCKICNRAKGNLDSVSYFYWINQIRAFGR